MDKDSYRKDSRDMNISFLIYSMDGGGAERMVTRLSRSFADRRHSVSILVFDEEKQAYTIGEKVAVHSIGSKNCRRLKRIPEEVCNIRKRIRKDKLDVIFVFMAALTAYAVAASFGTKCKVIGSERSNPKARQYNGLRQRLFDISVCCADGFIFQTEGAKSLYPRKVQKNGVIIGNIAPSIIKPCVPEIPYSICSVGRLHPIKDYPTLLRAFALINKRIPESTLHLYGQGEDENKLRQMAEEFEIIHSVYFHGFESDVISCMATHMVFVMTSISEGMPNALIEAMTLGLACVATDCDFGPRELIRNGHNGYLTEVGDYRNLAEKILDILQNEDLRHRLGDNAIKIRDSNSEEIIVEAYLTYANSVLRKERIMNRKIRNLPNGGGIRYTDKMIAYVELMIDDLADAIGSDERETFAAFYLDPHNKVVGLQQGLLAIPEIKRKISSEDKLRILEIGSGIGISCMLIKMFTGAEVIGAEPHPASYDKLLNCIKQLQKDNQELIYTAIDCGGEDLRVEDESIDIVCSFEVMEHVRDPYQVLKEIYRVLKPGGYAYISTVNYDSFYEGHYRRFWNPFIGIEGNRKNYIKKGLPAKFFSEVNFITKRNINKWVEEIGYEECKWNPRRDNVDYVDVKIDYPDGFSLGGVEWKPTFWHRIMENRVVSRMLSSFDREYKLYFMLKK